MFIKKKKNRSGTTSVVVAEKIKGVCKELITIGVSRDLSVIERLIIEAKEWIANEQERRYPRLDLFGEERKSCEEEILEVKRILSQVSNILINGTDLILDKVFDKVGFNIIKDEIFRKLVKARLSYPSSKSATVEYLKNHFDEECGWRMFLIKYLIMRMGRRMFWSFCLVIGGNRINLCRTREFADFGEVWRSSEKF